MGFVLGLIVGFAAGFYSDRIWLFVAAYWSYWSGISK